VSRCAAVGSAGVIEEVACVSLAVGCGRVLRAIGSLDDAGRVSRIMVGMKVISVVTVAYL